MNACKPLIALALAALLAAPAAADSLWKGNEDKPHWFSDTKARRVGDVVTILIKEESKAKTDLSQSHKKDSSTKAMVNELRAIFGINKPKDGATDESAGLPVVDWQSTRNYDATASAESEEELELRISATVREVLPNGNLLIDAARQIRHDRDVRVVHLTGIVRPQDVTRDNTVLSQSIAEARISYEGYGPANLTKRKGCANRVLDLIWPF